MNLYHYTSSQRLPLILDEMCLKPMENNVSFQEFHAGPDVILLTADEKATPGHALDMAYHDGTEWRFTVTAHRNEVYNWKESAKRLGRSAETIQTLITAGGEDYKFFYVSELTIPATQWLEIRNVQTGEKLDIFND